MSFQESPDPLVEQLQHVIDDLRQNIHHREFEKILTKIDKEYPFVDLYEFLEMYVNGEYSKVLIEKFHLVGYSDYYRLLKILQINKKRKSSQKTSKARLINLSDSKMAKRYQLLQKILIKFQTSIKNKIIHNTLRAIIILYLYSKEQNFTNKESIIQVMPNTIKDFEHLILMPHIPLASISNEKINKFTNSILLELQDSSILEINESNEFRLEKHQFLIADYIFNIIQKRAGIIYQELEVLLRKRLPFLSYIPPALFQVKLNELVTINKIIRKGGYWKLKPFYDQYFTLDDYVKLNSDTFNKNRKFFGRKITPSEFIKEVTELHKGDFEDQDDQVTRIAGMILSNSNMMNHISNDLDEFDFAVDLSNYEFTQQQQKIIKKLGLEITSNIIYVKVAINEVIKIQQLEDLTLKLQNRGLDEQGFIISFENIEKSVNDMLQNNKTIQLITKEKLKTWCKITPVIPSRVGAVAIVRQGDHRGSIVKIKSINYESGRANIVLFPKMNDDIQYIGNLEEITLSVDVVKFVDYSSKYFEFLGKLRKISKTNTFRKTIADGVLNSSKLNTASNIEFVSDKNIKCRFHGEFTVEIDLAKQSDKTSLIYGASDLFSCTCFRWNHQSRTTGLCEHLIFVLNESVKKILSSANELSSIRIESNLQKIEQKMDLFLDRLRYSSMNDSTSVQCPHCGKIGNSLVAVKDLFGYRQMNPDEKFLLRHQSRCKTCRHIS